MGDIDADDFSKLPFSQEQPQELAVTAAEVKHTRGAALFEQRYNCLQALLMQSVLLLDFRFSL